ncbi:MAG: porin family protein [Chitinophagaceae bacterium]
MRKLPVLFFAAVLGSSLTAYCQKTSFGITGGASLANMHLKSGDISISVDNKIGLTVGVFADVAISENFSFQPALNYVQKGAKNKMTDIGYESKLTLNYIELPFNFLFKPEMPRVRFFAGGGPSIAYALSGTEKESGNGNTYKYKFGNNPDDDDLKALDFGANFLTGIETKNGFLVSVNYNLGLSNLAPGSSSDGTIKSRYFGFKVGCMLKWKK